MAEESGQTVHFFSGAYLRELLAGWQQVRLVPVPVPHRKTGEPFKHGLARHSPPLNQVLTCHRPSSAGPVSAQFERSGEANPQFSDLQK